MRSSLAKKKKTEEVVKANDKLALARERFRNLLTAESDIRAAAIENLHFVYNVENGHWPAAIREERAKQNRPCLTSNKLRKYVAQVVNRERDQRVVGKVRPVDDNADIVTAKIIEGIIRQIEYASNSNEAYTSAGEAAVAGGFGYWRIITKESPDSFDQEAFIKKIDNQFSVYLDPRGNYAFIREGMTKKEFEAVYPDKLPSDFDLQGQGETYELWYETDKVFIADYYYKEKYDKTIAQILNPLNGKSMIIEITEDVPRGTIEANGFQILREKTIKATRVKWERISGCDILEEGYWVGDDIPIIEVVGDSFNIEGKQYKNGLITDAKDPQKMYNFWLTHMTETVALAPKSPYIVTPQEIKGYEEQWKEANTKNYPYLLVNAQGNTKPRREPPPQVPTGAAQMLQLAASDIQDTIGMYQASFGERSNERSGIAIRERAGRSEFGTYHFGDNFKRAVLASTKQLINIIPRIYDTERIVRILGEDNEDSLVQINHPFVDTATGEKAILNDLTIGKYDVVAEVGIYSTRRQEAVEQMTALMQSSPNISPLVLDLVFKFADWPGAQEIKARLEKHMNQLLGGKGGEEAGNAPSPMP